MSKSRLASFAVLVLGLVLFVSWAASAVQDLRDQVKDHGARIQALEAR